MPILESTSYRPPPLLSNCHFQTIYSSIGRRIPIPAYTRERLFTDDDDFLDLDWSKIGSNRLAILSHGLEGSTSSRYIRGMVRALNDEGWDVLAWNFRSCSGEPNLLPRSYHSGFTEDLARVIDHVEETCSYSTKVLVGFSIGGNVTLKYLGEQGSSAIAKIAGAVALSVPVDLAESAAVLTRNLNRMYLRDFLRTLRSKVLEKSSRFPDVLDVSSLATIKDFRDFDSRFTAPLHGFASAEEYWREASSKRFLNEIRVPTLLLSAMDDPFLGPSCYPFDVAREHPHLHLEVTPTGGHVGWISINRDGRYWSENRTAEFLGDLVK